MNINALYHQQDDPDVILSIDEEEVGGHLISGHLHTPRIESLPVRMLTTDVEKYFTVDNEVSKEDLPTIVKQLKGKRVFLP